MWSQLRNPPGGRDARIMLVAQFVDRAGTGVWAAAGVLYFALVAGLDAQQIGLLLGAAGVAGIAGSPLAGWLADRVPARTVLMGSHLVRMVALSALMFCHGFAALLPFVAVTALAERAAKMLEMLFATRIAGDRRSTYQALTRTSANAGYALGAGLAAIGLAVGTLAAYRALVLANVVTYLLAAVLVRRTREPGARTTAVPVPEQVPVPVPVATSEDAPSAAPAAAAPGPSAVANPWRDKGYLLFVLRDIPLCLDDSLLNVGLPLWLVGHTRAPHAFVPAFLAVNTVLVVVLQLRISAATEGPRRAVRAVVWYGVSLLACCLILATATGGGAISASLALLAAAVVVTLAELVRSVTSWELAVSLAPEHARAAYLGVAGMSQAIQKSAGPPLLTGVVMAAGPVGWAVLGAAVTGISVAQSAASRRRLAAMTLPQADRFDPAGASRSAQPVGLS
ncbi:MFS transporter [Streptacidiphilus sp. MAP5-3]|uniref:MFS transporter n=1 Tax=unclassified Streptacidiphilus TaxID=2643834 RepID=UPI00351277F7